jgi:hypothetical protein
LVDFNAVLVQEDRFSNKILAVIFAERTDQRLISTLTDSAKRVTVGVLFQNFTNFFLVIYKLIVSVGLVACKNTHSIGGFAIWREKGTLDLAGFSFAI